MPLASPFEPGARKNCADGHAAYRPSHKETAPQGLSRTVPGFSPKVEENSERIRRKDWLRGLDSNQDSQLQRLVSYQLDDPGTDTSSVAERRKCPQGPAVGSSSAGIHSDCFLRKSAV